MQDLVIFGRDLEVIQILGGNFTVRLETGHLVRVDGAHAEAIGQAPPEAVKPVGADGGAPTLEEVIWSQLRTCYDPEIPVNIVELGLIYALDLQPDDDGATRARVTMTLTAPGCGMGQVLKDDVTAKVRAVDGVSDAEVDLTFDPPWSPERMSEEARLELGFF
jgi:probable FeS assembly SUF system protein SufT